MTGKRFVAFGDVHGVYRHERAYSELRTFLKAFKPHVIVCLGDLVDLSALRTNATEEDHAMSVSEDVENALRVLREIKPHVYLFGNHEYRLLVKARSGNAAMRDFARRVLDDLTAAARKIKCAVLPYDRRDGVYELGTLRFVHGYAHGVYAAKAHAEVYGHCVFGHIHAYSAMTVPRWNREPAPGYAVSAPSMCYDMPYMSRLAGTLRQESGWLYGEVIRNAYHVEVARESQNYIT